MNLIKIDEFFINFKVVLKKIKLGKFTILVDCFENILNSISIYFSVLACMVVFQLSTFFLDRPSASPSFLRGKRS